MQDDRQRYNYTGVSSLVLEHVQDVFMLYYSTHFLLN